MTTMGGVQLPNETLHAIFENLSAPSLAVVVRTCHHFRLIAERILYTSIVICETLPPFSHGPAFNIYSATCASTILARPHLSDVVRKLSIRWHTDPGPRVGYLPLATPVLEILNRALRTLQHLEQLELALGLIGAPLDERVLLDGCHLPALRGFSFSGLGRGTLSPKVYAAPSTSTAISRFLSGAPAVSHLRLLDCYDALELPADALPALHDFRGSAIAASSVLPGRPVSLLGLVGHEFITERDLQRIAMSSVPIRWLDLSMMSVTPILLRDISRHLPAVEVMKVKLALRHTLHHALSGISLLAGLSPVLGAFTALHQLDLSPTSVDGVGRGNALEESALCTTWARACPALRHVVFPSRTEWRRDSDNADVWVPAAGATAAGGGYGKHECARKWVPWRGGEGCASRSGG
ncbi:hypothetical protein L227DRAFT_169486 [Lentinus tigrinus ALCF2SS1-6]|uniref:F-box domain-containing protein n=1 Tax=Lentinus tigrinus ALCF2SS1-6 TaxID=1328759 RepID=A0A5C2S6M3_9APHY|nr:hypothetical protein L227DRAFT_169486 [Lentinus tigrinus ALCF2SS1-6]